jgi:chromosome segregation ATPase
MTILTQDMARAFLNNSTNAQKYKFFNQGVQLEQLDQDYSLINTAIKNTEQVLLSKKEVIAELKERTNQSRLKVKQYESHDGLRQKLVEMQLQMAWVQVREVERLLEKKDNEIKTIRNKITKAEAEREDASTKFEQINSEFEAAEQEVKLQEEQLSPFEEQKALTKEKFDKNRLELQEIQVRIIHFLAFHNWHK